MEIRQGNKMQRRHVSPDRAATRDDNAHRTPTKQHEKVLILPLPLSLPGDLTEGNFLAVQNI